MVADFVLNIVQETLRGLAAGVEAALPRLVAGIVFFVIAYLAIRLILRALGASLARYYDERQQLVAKLFVTIAGIFLWFAAGLTFLKIVGMGEIAASLGTAVGFIGLGISYALSEMIEDTVSGVYLLRDPDFEVGDIIDVDGTEGRLTAIELRKSRFMLEDGDTWVVANRDVESEWTKRTNE